MTTMPTKRWPYPLTNDEWDLLLTTQREKAAEQIPIPMDAVVSDEGDSWAFSDRIDQLIERGANARAFYV